MNCSSEERESCGASKEEKEHQQLRERLHRIEHKMLVLSGKGGVGKSTVAAQLAGTLAAQGHRTGLLDIDIHGPSTPTLFGLQDARITQTESGLQPVEVGGNLKIMSIAFCLAHPDQALIWRGPMKTGAIRQFLTDVDWGELDYLIIDAPPGTGDETLSIAQMIPELDGGIMVTTPQELAAADVRKALSFCEKLEMRVLGIVENMSGFKCPCCGTETHIFDYGGGEKLAGDHGVPFLGRIPIDPALGRAADAGRTAPAGTEWAGAEAFEPIVKAVLKQL
jgi:Mrp family chromosome partitioning ATPase